MRPRVQTCVSLTVLCLRLSACMWAYLGVVVCICVWPCEHVCSYVQIHVCEYHCVCVCVDRGCVHVRLCVGGCISTYKRLSVCACVCLHASVWITSRVAVETSETGSSLRWKVILFFFFFSINRKQRNLFLKFCLGPQNVNFMQLGLQSLREERSFWRSSPRKLRIHCRVSNFSDYSTVRNKVSFYIYEI